MKNKQHIYVALITLILSIVFEIITDDEIGVESLKHLDAMDNFIFTLLVFIVAELYLLYIFIDEKIDTVTEELNNTIIINKIKDRELRKKILQMSKYIISLEENKTLFSEKKVFNLFFSRMEDDIDECNESLRKMENGRTQISKRNQNYWKDSILKNVEKSIWTTNIPEHGNSFGRSNKAELIKIQNDIILEKKIDITRVFIVNKPDIKEDFKYLRSVMKEQFDAGINIEILEYEDLIDINSRERYYDIIGFDFMILDESLLYLTHIEHDFTSAVNLTELVNNTKLLKEAQQFKETISYRSTKIKSLNDLVSYKLNS